MPTLHESVLSAEDLQRELARLRAEFDSRLSAIERRLDPPRVAAEAPPKPAPPPVSEEVIAIIAAAVTAFLGKKVKIHHAHLLDSGPSNWAQHGRAIIQASHNLVR